MWEARPRYGHDGDWLLIIGGAGGYAAGFGDRPVRLEDGTIGMQAAGGGLGQVQARIGRAFPGTDGLEVRGGVDLVLGATSGLAGVVGAVWQFSPFAFPLRVGVTAEVGAVFSLTGAQDLGFLVRAGAVASWSPIPQVQLEVALPEIGVITNGPGAFVVGAALRAGYRFQ